MRKGERKNTMKNLLLTLLIAMNIIMIVNSESSTLSSKSIPNMYEGNPCYLMSADEEYTPYVERDTLDSTDIYVITSPEDNTWI